MSIVAVNERGKSKANPKLRPVRSLAGTGDLGFTKRGRCHGHMDYGAGGKPLSLLSVFPAAAAAAERVRGAGNGGVQRHFEASPMNATPTPTSLLRV